LDTLGQSWFSVRFGQVGVVAGGTKNLAAEITLLGVHVTEPGSAVGTLRLGCPLAGIAVGIFHAAHQDDLAITGRRHPETLTNFVTRRAEVFSLGRARLPVVPYVIEEDPALAAAVCAMHSKFCND